DAVGAMHARYNDGQGAFGPLVDLALNLPPGATSVAGLDLDQDGYSELLVGIQTGESRARLDVHWNTAGSLGAAVGIDIGWVYPHGPAGPPSTIARGDFNGDGISDVMVVLERYNDIESSFAVISGRGNRTFAPSVDYPYLLDPREGVVHDFDRDGLDDIAIVCDYDVENGLVYLYKGMPGGELQRLPVMGMEHYPSSIALGDWNADGLADLVITHEFSETITFLRNLSTTQNPTAIAISLVAASASTDEVRLEWYSTAAHDFTLERSSVPGEWQAVGSFRPDGTGRVEATDRDIALSQRWGYRLTWLEAGLRKASPEVWVQIPDSVPLTLALTAAGPNPTRGALLFSIRLPSAEAATLELFDLGGRRVSSTRIALTGPGQYTRAVQPERPLAPGLYLARVHQGGSSASARIVIVP
ncbi:MAG: T9SS type A sorting domain-containing protein, partial [Candidatus Eisenbacteria bacterium]